MNTISVKPLQVASTPNAPTLTVLDHSGDSTFTWPQEQNSKVRDIIRDMLARGFVFYVPKRKLFGQSRQVVQELSQIQTTVELTGSTEQEFFRLLYDLQPAQRPAAEPMARTQDPDVILQGGALARRQAQGG